MTATRECPAVRHGTRGAYQAAGCRCPEAARAKRLYDKRMRTGTQRGGYVSPLGAQRRIQALGWMGWTNRQIAERSGVSLRTVEAITWGFTRSGRILVGIHDKIAATYRALENDKGPSTLRTSRAERAGWAPPAAWDDIDDPNEEPQGVASQLVLPKRVTRPEGATQSPPDIPGGSDEWQAAGACKRGHLNWRTYDSGRRECRTCDADRGRAIRASGRAAS